MKVRKLTNTSEVQVPVEIDGGTTVYLPPRKSIENVEVRNMNSISRFVKANVDLSEVPQMKEGQKRGIKRLNG